MGQTDANLVCDNYHILRDVVEESDLIFACTPGFIAEKTVQGRLQVLNIPDHPLQRRPTFIAKRRGRRPSPLANRVMAAARLALQTE